MILQCVCKNHYQDKVYGDGNRVMNPKKVKQGARQEYTCTVCGKEKA